MNQNEQLVNYKLINHINSKALQVVLHAKMSYFIIIDVRCVLILDLKVVCKSADMLGKHDHCHK